MLRREAWAFVLASYVLVGFAYGWPEDYRQSNTAFVLAAWAAFLVRTFVHHIGLVLLVIAVTTTVMRNRRLLLLTLPILAVTAGPTLWQYRSRTPPPARGEVMTVMSVNLLMVNERTQAILDEIRSVDPDVLLLQEYSEHWHQACRAALNETYPHARWIVRDDSFGIAIYSRRPFVGEVTTDLSLGTGWVPQMRAVVRLDGREVAFYNIHLLPPRKLEYTIEMRSQFADLLDRLAAEPLPVVVGGDFNFTETTANAASLARLGFVEAHEFAGRGRGSTWPMTSVLRYLPGLRFDHLYLSRDLACPAMRLGIGEGSDHRPVIARIGFRG